MGTTAVKPVAAPKLVNSAVELARASMTPASNKLFSDGALSFKFGDGTLASSLNSDVRFRFEGKGPAAERSLVPDSAAAKELMGTQAGVDLLKQLKTATNSIAGFESKSDFRGFILPRDEDGVVAGMILGGADRGDRAATATIKYMGVGAQDAEIGAELTKVIGEQREMVSKKYKIGVAAWNAGGWITLRPDIAREVLTSVGAYEPKPINLEAHAEVAVSHINHVPMHEVQHSISPTTNAFYKSPAKWMEEAVCEVLSDTPAIKKETAKETGINLKSYVEQLEAPPVVDLGWKPWAMPRASAADIKTNQTNVSRNYARSQDVLRDLLGMAGMGFQTKDQVSEVRDFLQGESVNTLSDRLARQIGERNKLPKAKFDDLSQRISGIIDVENGLDKLKRDFKLH